MERVEYMKNIIKKLSLLLSGLIVASCLSACSEPAEEGPKASDNIDFSKSVTAVISVENYGDISIELDHSAAPITVENFINLASDGFYDGLTFHRIMKDFMMQGGDPKGNGTGGSDNTIKGEFSANGVDNKLSHTRGAVSMARAKDFNSASSQFFIVHEDSLFLDGQYAVFGYVSEGMDVVDAICEDAKPIDGNGKIPAIHQPVITSVEILVET